MWESQNVPSEASAGRTLASALKRWSGARRWALAVHWRGHELIRVQVDRVRGTPPPVQVP